MAAFPKKITIMACLFLLAVVSIAAYTKYTGDLAKKTTANSFFGDVFPILTSEPTTNMTAIQIAIANASRPIGQPTSDGHELLNSTTTPQTADSNVTLGVPPAIDLGVPKKSYKEFTASLPTTSHILLPDKLPRGLLPTNVVGSDPKYLVIIDYSSKGYDTIAQSELTLQITSTLEDPYPKNVTVGGSFFKIGDWSAYYDPKAPEFEPEYIQLYGHTCGLLNVRIGTINYQFRAIPDITYDELIQIVVNMKPLH